MPPTTSPPIPLFFHFQTNDGARFELSDTEVDMSPRLVEMTQENYFHPTSPMQLRDIDEKTFLKILDWFNHNGLVPNNAPEPGIGPNTPFSEWEERYLQIDNWDLHLLLMAAFTLELPRLSAMLSRRICSVLRCHPVENIRAILQIPTDLDNEKATRAIAEEIAADAQREMESKDEEIGSDGEPRENNR